MNPTSTKRISGGRRVTIRLTRSVLCRFCDVFGGVPHLMVMRPAASIAALRIADASCVIAISGFQEAVVGVAGSWRNAKERR